MLKSSKLIRQVNTLARRR